MKKTYEKPTLVRREILGSVAASAVVVVSPFTKEI